MHAEWGRMGLGGGDKPFSIVFPGIAKPSQVRDWIVARGIRTLNAGGELAALPGRCSGGSRESRRRDGLISLATRRGNLHRGGPASSAALSEGRNWATGVATPKWLRSIVPAAT